MSRLDFETAPTPPFRLDLTAWALRRRPDNLIDRWADDTYRRVFIVGARPVAVAVQQIGSADAPRLRVTALAEDPPPDLQPSLLAILERVLGLRIDLHDFYASARTDPRLQALADRFRGLKPPRFPTLFETLANAIACQQVTLTLGLRILNRLVETFGPAATTGAEPAYAFPRPADLAGVDPGALRGLQFSRQKATALVGLARSVASGALVLEDVASLDDAAAVSWLQELRGVGRWTAEYVLLRGLGRLHVFPGDDVGARGNLERWLGTSGRLDYEGVQRVLAAWRPYGGLIYLHLLLDRLARVGAVQP